MNKELKIRQRKDECHYETSIEYGGMPLVIGYGFTSDEADTDALNKWENYV